MELRVASYVNLTLPSPGSPRIVDMTVEIEYGGATDPRFPTAFLVTVKDTSATGGYVFFKGVALDRMRITHLPTPPPTIDPIAELRAELVLTIREAATGARRQRSLGMVATRSHSPHLRRRFQSRHWPGGVATVGDHGIGLDHMFLICS